MEIKIGSTGLGVEELVLYPMVTTTKDTKSTKEENSLLKIRSGLQDCNLGSGPAGESILGGFGPPQPEKPVISTR